MTKKVNLKMILLVAFIMTAIVTLFTLTTAAETEGYYTYIVTNGEARITDVDTSISGDITIPSTLGGYPVTGTFGSAFACCSKLTSVIIGDNFTSISVSAFLECTSLTNVTIPDSVKSINNGAFLRCTSLKSVTIPDGVIEIGNYAFEGCDSLTSVTIGKSVTNIGNRAFHNCSSLEKIYFNATAMNDLSSGNYVFYKAGQVLNGIEVVIGKNVTRIPTFLFNPYYVSSNTPKITSVEFEEGSVCTNIGSSAFSNCTSLTSVTIPDSVESIGDSAFSNCTSLTGVTIPDSVESIGESAFYNCDSLTSVTIPDKVTSIENNAFSNCSGLTSVTIGNSVASIGNRAFSSCTALEKIYFNAMVMDDLDFENRLFDGAGQSGNGIDVVIGKNVTKIPAYLFYNSTKTSSVSFEEESVCTSIGEYAFSRCLSLTSITIPNNVTSIGADAFSSCISLTNIAIPDNVTNIDFGVFQNCTSLTSIKIPNGVTSIGSFAFYECSGLTSVTIPDGVTSIGDRAFYYCRSLTSVTIGDGVTSIESYAFYNCDNLTSVTIGNSVASIGNRAFYNCYKLVEVINKSRLSITKGVSDNGYIAYYALEVHSGDSKIVNKDDYLFYTYDGINYLLVYVGNDKELVFPESYNGENYQINQYAFYRCDNLISVTIPNSITSIGSYAFYDCYKLVEVINKSSLNITKGSWDNGEIAYYALEVHNGDSKIVNKDDYLFYTYNNVNYLLGYVGNDTELVLPESYNGQNYVIHNYAFYYCRSLTSVTIGDGVTSIGSYAFYNCDNLTSVTIPNSVTSIGSSAFYDCYSLTSVTIPDSVTSIGSDAFVGCSKLQYNVYDNAKYLGNSQNPYIYLAYSVNEDITSCNIYSQTKFIGTNAFASCSKLTNVTIPDSVTSIGSSAFSGCSKLTNVIIPDGVTSIENFTFENCSSLTNIEIPNDVTSIGGWAFQDCTSLTSVTIPDSVTDIGSYAFMGCASLTSVTIPDSVTDLGLETFNSCDNLEIIKFLSPTPWIYTDSISPTATIYGFVGSTAEGYAKRCNHTFVPFASDLTTVFEFDATFEADAEKVGIYSSVATLSRTRKDGEVSFDFLYAEGASGALYIKDMDGVYQPLYGSDGNALVLGKTETDITVVYDNKNGLVRYYINNSLPRYGEGKALAYDLPISDDFTKGDVISDTLTTLDGVDFTNAYTINESGTAEIVALQDNLDNSSSIRLLAGVDMLYYGAVGFETELYIDGVAQNKTSEQSGLVYSSVIAGTETVLPSAYGFRYFATLTIDGVDLSEYNGMTVHLIIKPYTQVGTTKYYGSAAKVDITNNEGIYSYAFDESYVG